MTPATQTEFDSETSIPATPDASQFASLLQASAIALLDTTSWIRVTGEDRVRWLNGMVTNSVQELQPGAGNYNFLLNAQGRIQGDATIFAQPDALLLETSSTLVAPLLTLLDRFIIMDDVELTDLSTTLSGLLIAGPLAAAHLQALDLSVTQLPPLSLQTLTWNASQIIVIHAHSPLVPCYELWTGSATAAALQSSLIAAGSSLAGPLPLEWLRILEGTPRYGTDIRDRELPQETNQSRALHFSKGCYLGQEIVERIRSRGNVHRTFCAFRLEGPLPAPGTILTHDAKPVGELTSAAAIPLPGNQPGSTIQLALGYARREALDRNQPLLYPGGIATPISLPYAVAAPNTAATSI